MKPKETSENSNLPEGHLWTESISFDDEELNQAIQIILSHPEALIGQGGAGKVYVFRDSCIKLVVNRHDSAQAKMFNLGNRIEEEFKIQLMANQMGEVSGVFTPAPYKYHKGEKTNAFVMERLDAVDMQQVYLGNIPLPENFKFDEFFSSLHDYIQELNERGILHHDLELRNIMIDKKSGRARVIDYGRAKYYPNGIPQRLENADFEAVEKMYDKFKEFLTK